MITIVLSTKAAKFIINDVNVVIAKHVKGGAGLRRFETEGRENEATYHVNIPAIDGLSLLVDELQEKINSKIQEIETLEREYEENTTELERRYREKIQEVELLEREYEDTSSQWEQRYKEKVLQAQNLESDIQQKTSDIESKVQEITRLKKLVSEFRKESEIIDRIQEKAKENVAKSRVISSQLQLEKRARKMENAKSKGLRQKDLERITELNEQIQRLNSRIRDLDQQIEQHEDAQRQIEQLQKSLDECLNRRDELLKRIASLENNKRQQTEQLQHASAKAESMAQLLEKIEIEAGESEKWRKMVIEQRELCEERLKEAESKYSDTWDAWLRNKLSGEDTITSSDDDSPV